jgi:hypothetical protein
MEGTEIEATRTEIPNLDLSIINAVETVDIEVRQPPFSSPKPSKEPKLPHPPLSSENHENGGKSFQENDERVVNKLRPLTKKEEETAKFVIELLFLSLLTTSAL